MPPIKSLVSECRAYIVTLILLLSVIMPMCSRYTKKKLVYIIIMVLSGHQPSSCSKYTKSNIYSSYNIKSVSNTKYIFLVHLAIY